MNKPTFDELKNNKISINIKNIEEGLDFLDWISSFDEFDECNEYDESEDIIECALESYEDNACLSFYDGGEMLYTNKEHDEFHNFKIIEWGDFMNNKATIKVTKEELKDKIEHMEQELKLVKEQFKKLEEEPKLTPLEQFEKDIKDNGLEYTDKDIKKSELREKIIKELTLFARLHDDEVTDIENNDGYVIYKNYDLLDVDYVPSGYSGEWNVYFETDEIAQKAIETFKDDLNEYYDM